jgi:hypothetical protein
MTPDDIRYLTLVDDSGTVLYDSRTDVPCDMEKWQKTYAKHAAQNPFWA